MTDVSYIYGELLEAYFDCRKNKRNKRSALDFELSYIQELYTLADELFMRTYEIGTSISFIVTRPTWREVFAASFRDRIVHHYIKRRLEPLFEEEFIEDTYNCRNGKGTLYGIRRVEDMVRVCSGEYGKDCYIGKFDMKGFFMSIHKPTLWLMLEGFINERYHGEDKELLLWLVKKVVLHCPEKNCIRQSPLWMWERIPAEKSLFTVGDDYGLPIGNITSQMFANFYLHKFDLYMSRKFGFYGRYVDDFVVVSERKRDILNAIPSMRRELARLHVTLHPKKIYVQHYSKGVKFTGAVVKPGRCYIHNRAVRNFRKMISEYGSNEIRADTAERFVCRANSYLGILGQFDTYAIRRRMVSTIPEGWFKYIYVGGRFQKLVCKNRYKEISIVKTNLKDKYYD